MATVEDEINQAGAQIVWVLEFDQVGRPGTAARCRDFMAARGSAKGICVGDSETMPTPGVWDDSDFAIGRGFDIIVRRSTMEIEWVSTHGTPGGNENLNGQEVLAEVQRIIAGN